MPDLPAGTVTFLFTDIEGSTQLIRRLGDDRYAEVLALQRALVRDAVAREGGVEVDTSGDGFFVAFPAATTAARAALEIQRAITRQPWPQGVAPRLRIGLHTGEPVVTAAGYVGLDVHRAARLCSVCHGGQVLLSETTRRLLHLDQVPGASVRELGVHRLKDLQEPEPIAQLTAGDLPGDFPPLHTLTTTPNNLPVQPTTFIGRVREIAEIKTVLERSRIVTLTGPAGSGKTRLAFQAAADLIDVFPDGVWLVELQTLTDRSQIAPAVAAALRVPEEVSRPAQQLIEQALRGRTTLLILDNCEHLADACAELAAALTRTCPGLRVLATSRQALRAPGEATYPVISLPLPRLSPVLSLEELSRNDAVALFVSRAQLSRHDFALTEETGPPVARLVRRLDGIPLAIELAAARTRLLKVAEIEARLEDRLQLVINGRRAGTRRQTLREALDWSYDLLAEDERLLFRRLSVFSGLCRLEAVEAVCADDRIPRRKVLDVVEELVDRSLLQPDRAGDLRGFRMLEIMREYGMEKLESSGEEEVMRDRHLSFFTETASAAAAAVRGARQQQALTELSADHDNFRAALRWAIRAERLEQGLRLAGHLWWFWYIRGHWAEASHWLEQLFVPGKASPSAAVIEPLNGAAYLAWRQGNYAEAEARAEEARRLSQAFASRRGEAHALVTLGLLARRRGAFAESVDHHERSLAAFRTLEDAWETARSLRLLAITLSYIGEYDRALALFEESRATCQRLEDRHGVAIATYGLARVYANMGRCGQALVLLDEAEALYRALEDKEGLASVQQTRGIAEICRGDYDRARALLEQSLGHFRESGDRWSTRDVLTSLAVALTGLGDYEGAAARVMEGLADERQDSARWDILGIAEGLEVLAAAESARGRRETAARWLGAAASVRERTRAPVPPYRQGEYDALITALQQALPPESYCAAFNAGRSLTPDEIVTALRSGHKP